MAIGSASGISVTDVRSSTDGPAAPLGFEVVKSAGYSSGGDHLGYQTWVYVKNAEASTAFAQGTVVTMNTAGSSEKLAFQGVVAPAATGGTPRGLVLGVAQHAIAAGSFGFILKKGRGEVLAGAGTITATSPIVVDDDAAAAGEAMSAAGLAAAVKFDVEIGLSLENGTIADGSLATCLLDI